MDDAFIHAVQCKVARQSVTVSAVRGQRTHGLVHAARNALVDLPLGPFGTSRRAVFSRHLDLATTHIRCRLPRAARTYGIARKVLNIFLRNALYTTYLRDNYDLARSEAFYEIPLDSIVAHAMRKNLPRGSLPRWQGVKNLTPAVNALYQSAAQTLAADVAVPRVHLDT